jgi:predicted outer membrane repeat protein
MYSEYSSATLTNVTFSGNSADTTGGAIENIDAKGDLVLNNVILWGDSAGNDGQEIWNESASAVLNNSVVQGGCLEGEGNTCDHVSDYDPKLGPLADNGGYTPTMLPGAGGSAIDTGNNATCAATDQRGYARPQDGNNDHTAVCDIGAVEVLSEYIFVNGFDGN